MEEKCYKVLELFAGIGAFSKALDKVGIKHEIVDAVEIDKYAIKSFNAIHGTNFEVQDITTWDKDIDVDIIMHGSPCQDISLAGLQKGADEGSGTRSSLMYESIRIIDKLKPKYVIWENVKNLISKKHFPNFQAYITRMSELGYKSFYKVLNAKDFGVPQNRERVYTISILIEDGVAPEFEFPTPQPLTVRLKDILEPKVDDKYYLSDKMLDYLYGVNQKKSKFPRGERFKQALKGPNEKGIANTISTIPGNRPVDNFIKSDENLVSSNHDSNTVEKAGHIPQWHQRGAIYNENGIAPTLCATDYKTPKLTTINDTSQEKENTDINQVVRKYGIFDTESSRHQAGSVYDQDGLSPTLDTMQGGWRQPCIEEYKEVSTDKLMRIDVPQTVRVRKYPVDTDKLQDLLRLAKEESGLTIKEIAERLNVPKTKAEHWFRTDGSFAIPEEIIWFNIKDLLNIETYEFDKAIMTFEEREGVYEQSNRCYDEEGIAPTITCANEEKVITKETDNSFVSKHYENFINKNGYIPEMFNPYNESEITDIAPTQTTQCGSTTSSAVVLKTENNTEITGRAYARDFGSKGKIQNKDYVDTLTASMGTGGGNVPLVPVEDHINIRNNTKQGYLEAYEGDGVNLSSRMKYQRGNVQKGMIQTLDCTGGTSKGVVVREPHQMSLDELGLELNNQDTNKVLCGTEEKKINDDIQQDRIYENNLKIRKLTPKECWRLMAFEDEDYEKASQFNSATQLYKQAGNSIVVDVLARIAENLLKDKK